MFSRFKDRKYLKNYQETFQSYSYFREAYRSCLYAIGMWLINPMNWKEHQVLRERSVLTGHFGAQASATDSSFISGMC
jgi:hypothetical protein